MTENIIKIIDLLISLTTKIEELEKENKRLKAEACSIPNPSAFTGEDC